MDWFSDIPKMFLLGMVIIMAIGAIVFIVGMNNGNTEATNENLEKTTAYVTGNSIPTEINWISYLSNKLSGHPFILLMAVLVVFWLFGYFLPKK